MPAPKWAHDVLDAWCDGAHSGRLAYKITAGRVVRILPVGPLLMPPPGDDERLIGRVPPPCPQCTHPTVVLDEGRKVHCARCDATWQVKEYRAAIRKVLTGKP